MKNWRILKTSPVCKENQKHEWIKSPCKLSLAGRPYFIFICKNCYTEHRKFFYHYRWISRYLKPTN